MPAVISHRHCINRISHPRCRGTAEIVQVGLKTRETEGVVVCKFAGKLSMEENRVKLT